MLLTKIFSNFFNSEKTGGLILIACTVISLVLSNSALQTGYINFWHLEVAGSSLAHWINDGLMAIFFLLIGIELEREIYVGELSNIRNALLPVIAALGGILIPAALFLLLNYGTPAQAGAGVPMATDIAFALAVLSLVGKGIPASLKVFLTALAVIDDLCAIIVIAIFYTSTLVLSNLIIALLIFIALIVLNRLKVYNVLVYVIGGIAMWYFMLHSGIHATIAGVLLAFAIPFRKTGGKSPSAVIEHYIHKPVAFVILPLFALANTSIVIDQNWMQNFSGPNSIGILLGLIIGKPIGITLFSLLAVTLGLTTLPADLKWKQIIGAGLLAGIGFTMSIFITLLAYEDASLINSSKLMVLVASVFSGIAGFLWLKSVSKKSVTHL